MYKNSKNDLIKLGTTLKVSMSLPVQIFTDRNLQNEFQCKICLNVIQQCYSTQCGHLFCSKCIMKQLSPPSISEYSSSSSSSSDDDQHPQIKQNKKSKNHKGYGKCPACQQLLQIGDIFPAPYVDKKIREKIIRCLHFNKGCLWTGKVNELLKKSDGHLKQCGYTISTCKYCKEKIVRNQMVKHQNDECKSNYMKCPYSMYGCNFECRIRDMEQHCHVNELKHVKLKLDYLENQLFVPEIVKIKGMTGFNNSYIESNGKYYLINKQKKKKHKYNLNELQPITYKKNGGYTLEFNQTECIWHLRSLYYGLIAYGMPKNISIDYDKQNGMMVRQLNNFMNDNCVWSVYFKHGVKQSLIIDNNVKVESLQLSDGMMKKWNINDETDTEEINGEFEQNFEIDNNNNNNNNDQYDREGMNNGPGNNNKYGYHHGQESSWYSIVFGDDGSLVMKKKKLTVELFFCLYLSVIM